MQQREASNEVMNKVYPCPRCKTQNFATGARLRQAGRVPLTCWKCGEEFEKIRPIPAKHKEKIIKFR